MKMRALFSGAALFFLIVVYACGSEAESVSGNDPRADSGEQMALRVYSDDLSSSKALVTGYISDINDLAFLDSSEYAYENDTKQLYALTNSLVSSTEEGWALKFPSDASYDAYHVTFYLPRDMAQVMVEVSDGLKYNYYLSNDSSVVDVQGYDVANPVVAIEYHQTS